MTQKLPIYTIPASYSFLDELAKGLWQQSGEDFQKLSEILVLLPSRRACRHLSEAFLQFFDGNPSLLPRMTPLGDLNEDELQILSYDTDFIEDVMALPPAISSLKRTFLIAPLLLEKSGMVSSMDQAVSLAKELGQFLDEIVTEGASIEDLKNIVPEDMAEHWNKTLSFLQILFEDWPHMLKQNGVIDPAERRNRIIDIQTKIWEQKNPETPVVVAGVMGSIPAAARLIQTVLGLPQGQVVLPAVDLFLDEESWTILTENHPQYGFKKLFSDMGINRSNISIYPVCEASEDEKARFISEVMRPSETSDRWLALQPFAEETLKHFEVIEAENDNEEAMSIALVLREALEVKNQTASLVTPDRNLARRVSSIMQRWNISVDDTGGIPLHLTPIGLWLYLTARMVEENFSALALLNVLKHSFAACGIEKQALSQQSFYLDKNYMRGQVSYQGIENLIETLKGEEGFDITFLENLRHEVSDFCNLIAQGKNFKECLKAHVAMAEGIATSKERHGKDVLWRGEEGEVAAQFVIDLREVLQAIDFNHKGEYSYAKMIKELMQGYQVRSKYGTHPKLAIMGLMESRLMQSDIIVLAGLNEAVWPPEPKIDPFLSRKMRLNMGLPTPDKAIGMAAHDFMEKFCGKKVFLTRSLKSNGAPTVPSRWLLRLETVLEKSKIEIPINTTYTSWARKIDTPEVIKPFERPMPKPQLAYRPKEYSVSSVARLMKDPYGFYAQKILKLYKIDEIGKKPDYREKGQFVHKVLEEFTKIYPDRIDKEAHKKLLEIGQQYLPVFCKNTTQQTFWWQRFKALSTWLIEEEEKRREIARVCLTEQEGFAVLSENGFDFRLKARADRIDELRDKSGYIIVDYKTGGKPAIKKIEDGTEPQLPLEALILQEGGYGGIEKGANVDALEHWVVKGTKDDEIKKFSPKKGMEDFLVETREGVIRLFLIFMDENFPYHVFIQGENEYNDYDHLERLQEWRKGGKD